MSKALASSGRADTGFLNTNIYIKLLNNSIDPETIIKQLAKAGPEGMRFLMHFLSDRCKKLQKILNTIHDIALEIESDKAAEKLFHCILDSIDAKYGSIYFTSSGNNKINIQNTNWPEQRAELVADQIYGIKTILKGEIINVCNIRSSEGVSKTKFSSHPQWPKAIVNLSPTV
jgi:adenylate cyclase